MLKEQDECIYTVQCAKYCTRILHTTDVEDNTIKYCQGVELRDLPKYYYTEYKPRYSTRRSNINPGGTHTSKMLDCSVDMDIMSMEEMDPMGFVVMDHVVDKVNEVKMSHRRGPEQPQEYIRQEGEVKR